MVDDEGPSRTTLGVLVAALLAVPLAGACLLWPRGKPEAREEPKPAAAPTVVTQLAPVPVVTEAPVVPDQRPDANGNVWPNQEQHAKEARDAAWEAKKRRRGGARGVIGGGISDEEQARRDREWIDEQRAKESGRGYGGGR